MMKNILLFGLKNSGKTTAGKELAKLLNYNFIDLDSLIENIYFKTTKIKLSYKSIYIKHGEIYFRKLEKEAAHSLIKDNSTVISFGGGTLINKSLHSFIQNLGTLFYLKITYKIFAERILTKNNIDNFPSFLDLQNIEDSLKKIYLERTTIYDLIPAKIINADEICTNKIVMEIYNAIK